MRRLLPVLFLSAVVLLFGADPWAPSDLIQPAQVAKTTDNALVIHVGFNVMYRSAHIANSVYAGPASQKDGIEALKKAVAGQPLARNIIIYCGCCPFDKCPNIRPAFQTLHDLGYANVKVLSIPENLKTDWIDKGYPTEKRAE